MEKSTGKTPDELVGPEMPSSCSYVYDVFMDMNMGRSYGYSGPDPISYESIWAWCNLTETRLSSWEVRVLKRVDVLYVGTMNED